MTAAPPGVWIVMMTGKDCNCSRGVYIARLMDQKKYIKEGQIQVYCVIRYSKYHSIQTAVLYQSFDAEHFGKLFLCCIAMMKGVGKLRYLCVLYIKIKNRIIKHFISVAELNLYANGLSI